MQDTYTLSEASALYKPSKKTIERRVKEIAESPTHPQRGHVFPDPTEYEQKCQLNQRYTFRVTQELLDELFDRKDESPAARKQPTTAATSKSRGGDSGVVAALYDDRVSDLKHQIEQLEHQIKIKDSQLSSVHKTLQRKTENESRMQQQFTALLASGNPDWKRGEVVIQPKKRPGNVRAFLSRDVRSLFRRSR